MKPTKWPWPIIVFNFLYLLIYTFYYLSIKNFEFLWYVLVLLFFMFLIGATLKRSRFDNLILWGLSLWGFLHMSGGGIKIGGGVLYGLPVLRLAEVGDTFIIKFDQVVHAFGFGVATLVFWHLLKFYLGAKVNYKVIYPIAVLGGMGLGALNEVVEFMAVIFLPKTGVGGYYNNALDLVFNLIGAILAIILIHFQRKKSGSSLK